jgi:hypothetical protein
MMMRVGQPRLSFRTRLRRGWNITKLGMHVVRADPELMVYTLLSGLFSVGAAIGLLAATGGMGFFVSGEDGVESGMLVGMFLTYMVVGMITVFWNAAIIASAYERLTTGSNPSFSYGIKEAAKRLPAIIVWGLISGTVGLIVGLLEGMAQDDNPVVRAIGSIASLIVKVAWWMTTFFVVPMLVLEGYQVGESMRRSPELFEKTWGEDVVSMGGTGIVNFLVILLVVLICMPLFALGELGMGLAFALMFIGIGLSVLFFTACEAVNRASLYYYAKTGESPPLAQKYDLDF